MKAIWAAMVGLGVATAVYAVWTQDSGSKPVMTNVNSKGVGVAPGGVNASNTGRALTPAKGHQLAMFAGGCFWGTENFFRKTPGVVATAVGYAGGTEPNPTYELVCSHKTKYREVALVEFDPAVISYRKLVDHFWDFVDIDDDFGQGPDRGEQYRSAVYAFDAEQYKVASASKADIEKQVGHQITTGLMNWKPFWLAEDYHQQYDEKNGVESCPTHRKA